jgi:ASPIC and UnbV
VTVTVGSRRLTAWRLGGGSYQSACDPRIHIGLGDADRADEIEVTWPSGRVDHFGQLAADNGYRLREGAGMAEPLKGFAPKNTAPATTAIRTGAGPKTDRAGAPRSADAELQNRPRQLPDRKNPRRAELNSLSPSPAFNLSSGAS